MSNVLLGDIRIRQIPFPIHFSFVWPKITADSSTGHARWLSRAETIRCVVYGVLVSLLLPLSATADELDTERRIHFNIPQQRADLALTQFAKQASLTLLFPFDGVRERTANRLVGEYSVKDAIGLLLLDTGLTPTLKNRLVLDIAIDDETNNAGGSMNVKKKAGVGAILAAVFSVSTSAQEAVDADTNKDRQVLDEIVVTGTTIRGVYPESAPLDIYDAEDIALSGATTLERFFETLPQNVNTHGVNTQVLGPGDGDPSRGGGVDIRGLGVGTTLVLLNGRRLTAPDGTSPDTSLIPLGAVERVEILADGASAVYGSDAIGGVVNIILRDDFEGVDMSASYGGATHGGRERTQADIAAGTSWGSGSGFLAYSYSTEDDLDAGERDFSSQALTPMSLLPNEVKQSIFGGIDHSLTNRLDVFGNLLHSKRDVSNLFTSPFNGTTENEIDQDQVFISGGLDYEVRDKLFFQFEGTYVSYEEVVASTPRAIGVPDITFVDKGDSLDLLAKLDGSLIELASGEVKFSFGGGYSTQEFQSGRFRPSTPLEFDFFDRDSYFGFAEIFAPLVSEERNIAGIRRLELSAATRYTEYSDFGDAWTPRFGVLWSPFDGLNLRSTYARGFRAPTLSELNPNSSRAALFPLARPGRPDPFSPDDSTVIMQLTGGVKDGIVPEFSDTVTFGFDYVPEALPGLKISATYFSIDYVDRLAILPLTPLVSDPEGFAFLFNTSPDVDDFAEIISSGAFLRDARGLVADLTDPAAIADVVTVIVDRRPDNLAESKSEGFDIAIDYGHETPFGNLSYGLRLTETLTSTQRAATASPELSLLDTVGNPVTTKLNGFAGLQSGGFSGQVNVNYIDRYRNTTVDPEQPIVSWTTVDLSLRYDFDVQNSTLLNDLAMSLTVNNLFDTDPPFVAAQGFTGLDGLFHPTGYDPVNANPRGRYITVGLAKQF